MQGKDRRQLTAQFYSRTVNRSYQNLSAANRRTNNFALSAICSCQFKINRIWMCQIT